MSFYKLCNNVYSLISILFIIVSEYVTYKITRNYPEMIESLANRLALINILYVKLFQSFALDNNMIDEEINSKLIKYTDNVTWNDEDISNTDLISVANKYKLDLNSSNNKPINSGMISLVFKIPKEKSEECMIIKLKRKDIDKKLDDAIQQVLFIVYILSYIPSLKNLQIYDVIEKNIDSIREQTNFMEEIENMELIRKNCNKMKYVIIPKVYKEVTEELPNVIMMDYMKGERITNIKEEDYKEYAKLLIKFGLVTYIMHGCTHGDLHSGNILFIEDENRKKKIGILDFGIIYKYDEKFKCDMFNLLSNLNELGNEELLKKAFKAIVEPEDALERLPKEDYKKLIDISIELLEESLKNKKKANQYQVFKFLSIMKEYVSKKELSELGITLKDDFIKSQMFIAMSHGVTIKLCNQENVLEVVEECINEIFKTKLLF
jgi:predicted unusual protein kinase regulating ubiquinone biosynthesis (AarF/ABC1/UbiB family)